MKRFTIVTALLILATITAAEDSAIFLNHAEDGLSVICDKGLPYNGQQWGSPDDPSVLWSRYLEWPIYQTSANAPDGYVFAGTYLNPPKEAELFSLTGGGVPEWVYGGTEFYTDAGDDAFVLAAVDEDASGVTVIKWTGPGTGSPDWSTNFPGRYLGNYGPYVVVSKNASTIAAILTESAQSELVMFDQGSSTPLVDYLATGLSFPRCLQISDDGRYAAFRTNTHVVVYDRDLNAVREQIYIGFGATPMDISGDGDLIAFGWSSLEVREWTGASYQTLWTWSESGYYLSKVSISADGSTIVAGWYNSSFSSVKVTVHNSSTANPIWTYQYPTSSGTYQESIRDIELSDDGRYFIAGSFGDDANLNPEVHLFDREAGSTPYFTVDMPGSVFSVDISPEGYYATACGKHVHANVSGHGGDIVAIDLDLAAPGVAITLTPYNPPIVIPASGGSFDFNLAVANHEAVAQSFDLWIMVRLPSGNWYGPVLGPVELTLAAGDSLARDRTQAIPERASAGIYTYEGRVGDYPDDIWDSDNFPFEKLALGEGTPIGEWSNWGSDFEEWLTEPVLEAPSGFTIYEPHPNPFNPTTAISFALPDPALVNLSVYDISGRQVAELVNGWRSAGIHEVTLDGWNLASGIYLYQLTAADFRATGKMVLIK